ncbi:uncharacterized protein LOC135463776 [Liolophura sinensis]|uniref:uncharacterized protein LOC135463776 n=1 Tax=Liolophura sinensis TaxID=3198878 RepID=UPI003158F273
MVLCKYYQQGTCRFGDRCRFEHPPSDTGYYNQGNYNSNNAYKWYGRGYRGGDKGSNRGVTFRATFSSSNRFEALSQQDGKQSSGKAANGLLNLSTQDVLEMISADMENWEPSHTWIFSCYTYYKDGSCLPGMDDISPEELRFEAYEAEKSGNGQLYVLKVNNLINKFRQIRTELSRPSMQTKQKLIQFIEDDMSRLERGLGAASIPTSSALSCGSSFGSGFGQSSSGQSTGLFGKPAPTSNNLFGNSQSTPIFGNNQSSGTALGNIQTENVFGAGQTTGSVFGNNQSGSLFGNNQSESLFWNNQSAESMFGINQSGGSLFGGNQPTGAFGSNQGGGSILSNTQSQGTNFFGNNGQSGFQQTTDSSSGLFGKPAFGGASTAGFGLAEVQGNVFGNNAGTSGGASGTATTGSSAFGQPVFGAAGGALSTQPTASASSTSSTTESSTYTPLNELTPEERQQFEAGHFTAGRLPTRPPPKEFC